MTLSLLVAALAASLVILAGPTPAPRSAPGNERPVVVWGATSDTAARMVAAVGGVPGPALDLVGGVAARLDGAQIAAVEAAGLEVISDAPLALADAGFEAEPVADHQFSAMNPGGDWDLEAGAGVGVALIDTGVAESEDLRGRLVLGPDLTDEGDNRDHYGHGTFMAGLIAGDGTLSATGPSRHVGMAPGAHIVSVKIAGADGATSLSKLLNAIGWVVLNADQHAVRVLNLSISVPPLSSDYHADPLSAAVEAAWASGITVVTAAGNDGGVVGSPARDPWVITAGALDVGSALGPEDDTVPAWSARGTTKWGAKPELLAPGVSVVSLAAPGSTVVSGNPGSVVDGSYLRGTGTSMAAAMVSGAVAVLTEHHAAATPDDFKAALVSAGRPVGTELGQAVDLQAADLVPVGSTDAWWPRRPIAFDGLGIGLVDRMPWAGSRWADASWVGSRWAGSRWAGTGWIDHQWTGSRWATEEFAGSRWAGSRWAGSRWAGSRWAGSRWAGSRWAADVWSGSRWAGTNWSGARFEGSRWAGTAWTGSRWAGSRWADQQWAGSRWAGAFR